MRLARLAKAIFYQLDLPEVIQWRKSLLGASANDIFMQASLLETGWMDELKTRHPQAQFIFVFEGVLMYFEEKQVKKGIA